MGTKTERHLKVYGYESKWNANSAGGVYQDLLGTRRTPHQNTDHTADMVLKGRIYFI